MALTKPSPFKTKRFPLVNETYSRNAGNTLDTEYTNCVFTSLPNLEGEAKRVLVSKRLGMSRSSNAPSYTSHLASIVPYSFSSRLLRGLWTNGSDTRLITYDFSLDTYTTIATINGTTVGTINEGLSGSTPALLFRLKAGSTSYAYFYPEGGAVTQIVDADFPNTTAVSDLVYMNGYTFILTSTGKIYNSDPNSMSAWSATSFISTAFQTNNAVGLLRYRDKLVALGETGLEFYKDVGNPSASPLQRIDELTIRHIGVNIDTSEINVTRTTPNYLSAGNTIYWVGSTVSGKNSAIYYLDNYQPVRLTDDTIESVFDSDNIGELITVTDVLNEPVLFVRTRTGVVWLYYLALKRWTKWTGTFALTAPFLRAFLFPTTSLNKATRLITVSGTGSNVAYTTLSLGFYSDTNSSSTTTSYTMKIQLPQLDFGTEKRKRIHKLKVIGYDSTAASATSISWSDDDLQNFNTARTIDMNNGRTYLSNCGIWRKRSIKIENAANAAFDAEAIEIDYSQMGS